MMRTIRVGAILLGLLWLVPPEAALGGVNIKAKGGGLSVEVPGVGSGQLGPKGTKVDLENVGRVETDAMGASTRVVIGGKATATVDLSGATVEVVGFGTGRVTSDGRVQVSKDGIWWDVGPDGIRNRKGELVFTVAPDGSFKPKGMSDEDWTAVKFPSMRNFQSAFKDNKKEIIQRMRDRWSVVALGLEVDWQEYEEFSKAIAASVVAGNPAPAAKYLDELSKRMVEEIANNLKDAVDLPKVIDAMALARALKNAVEGRPPIEANILGLDAAHSWRVKIGILTYRHWKEISYIYTDPLAGLSGRSTVVNGPNTFQPYVAVERVAAAPLPPAPILGIGAKLIPLDIDGIAPAPGGTKFSGVEVTKVSGGAFGGWYGLNVGDVIVDLNGNKITDEPEFRRLEADHHGFLRMNVLKRGTGQVERITIPVNE